MIELRSFRVAAVLACLVTDARVRADVRVNLVGQWGGTPNAVAMRDNLAFVAVGPRVVVLDLSDPASPRRVGQSQPLSSWLGRVVLDGDRAYAAAADFGVEILDISDPAEPVRLGRVGVNIGARAAWTRDVAVFGALVFVAAEHTGLRIYDVSDPTAPVEMGSYDPGEPSVAVAASDGYAYLSSWYGLQVLDVSDPRSPQLVGSLEALPERFALVGDLAYVAELGYGLSIIDLSDPAQPSRIGSVEMPDDYPFDVTVDGAYAYVADMSAGMQICDVRDPRAPQLIGSYALNGDIVGRAHGVAVHQGVACMAEWPNRFHVVDVQQPANPVRRAIHNEIGHAMKCPYANGRVFFGGYTPGVQLLDVADPANPFRIASFGESRISTVDSHGEYAYVAEHSAGMAIYSLTNPAQPEFLSRVDTAESVINARRFGDYVYLANHRAGVAVVDARDPMSPIVVAVVPMERALDILRVDDVLFVADARQGLVSIDVHDPEAPVVLGSHPAGSAHCLALVGPYLYVGGDGVRVFNVSDAAHPVEVAMIGANCTVERMVQVSDRVFVTSCRLGILDISNPATPHWIGFYDTRGPWIGDLAVADGVVYLATREGGLEIVRVSDLVIGLSHLTELLSAYGVCSGEPGYNGWGDWDRSGCVDLHDLLALLARFGR